MEGGRGREGGIEEEEGGMEGEGEERRSEGYGEETSYLDTDFRPILQRQTN